MNNVSGNISNHVAVLLSFYHGDTYIYDQLNSIWSQGPNVQIWISDDGDMAQTYLLLEKQIGNNLHIVEGPKAGFAKNFLSMIGNPDIQAEYYAFADQDDVWEKDKLSKAINWLKTIPEDRPACYCSRTKLIDSEGNDIGLSSLFKKQSSFRNALVQSIAGGNTMVMNQAARILLAKTKEESVVSHDWWVYMLITGAGGVVYYDPHPSCLYRQHGGNLVGSNDTFRGQLSRAVQLLKGRFRVWNDINCHALQNYKDLLTPENRQAFDNFCQARKSWLLPRLRLMWKSGVHRQTALGNLGIFIATIFNRV